MKYLSTLQDKYDVINAKFRIGSSSCDLAKSIVRQGLLTTTASEKKEVGKEFGLSPDTVGGVFTKLRSLGLLGTNAPMPPIPPNTPSRENTSQPLSSSQQDVASHTPLEASETTSSQEFATKGDLERLETAIVGLTTLLGNDEDEEGSEEYNESVEVSQEPPQIAEQTRTILEESSMKQMGTWIFAKNLLYFDFARQGAFGGVLENFDGNWSDFVNTVIDDYFNRTSNVGIGLLKRRFA